MNNTVVEITFRTEEGLPLVSTPYMRLILESYLARAQTKYPVKIVSLMFMANHLHAIIVVEDPEDVSDFVAYFKRETAFAVNKLLGRNKHTVWCEGYDSPIVLDAEKVVQRLVYAYTNPQTARLVNAIEDYTNVSTWKEFLSGESSRRFIPTFPRYAVPTLSLDHSTPDDVRVLNQILEEAFGKAELLIEPFAWLECFADTAGRDPLEIVPEVVKRVRSEEQCLKVRKGEIVLGAEALLHQDIRKPYLPKKRGKRMLCLSTTKEPRIAFISWFFEESRIAARAIRQWRENNIPLRLPPGFFAPGGRLLCNVFPESLRL